MKTKIKYNYARLPLKKAYNVRDLGGYAADNRKPTKFHAFLRTDNLEHLTPEDIQFLKDYGVTAAIDLRGESESIEHPNPLKFEKDVNFINIPFIVDGIMDVRKAAVPGFHVPGFYQDLIDSHEKVYEIMSFILKQKGCVLYHCMAGKDRTGVVSMLLLGICGVSKEDIIANYQVTRTYLKENVELKLPDELMNLNYSEPDWMEETYDYLINKYGSFEEYFLTVGFSKKAIKKLRKRLLTN